MSTQSEVQRLEAEVLGIEGALRECARTEKRASVASIATAATLLGLIVSLLFINYSRVCAEMSQDKIVRSLTQQLGEIAPLALTEIHRLGQDLLPVYSEEFRTQLEARWPELAAKVESELQEIGNRALTDANAALKESEERVEAKLRQAIFACYPEVNNASQREAIERHLKVTCDQALALTLASFDRTFSKDLHRLQETVLKFEISDGPEDQVELHKQFLRLWLRLLDQEVLEI